MPLQGIPDSRSLAAPPTEFPDLKLHSRRRGRPPIRSLPGVANDILYA
jgi:hypothetical protein